MTQIRRHFPFFYPTLALAAAVASTLWLTELPQPAQAESLSRLLINGVTTAVQQKAPAALPDRLESGSEAGANATRLTSELHWFKSLAAAKAAAAEEQKPIFWMHMLGDIDGKT